MPNWYGSIAAGLFVACLFVAGLIPVGWASPARAAEPWSGPTAAIPADGGDSAIIVARTADAWQQLWARIGRPAPRALDAEREIAVAVVLGRRRTGGFRVDLGEAEPAAPFVAIPFAEHRPSRSAFVPQVITAPWAVRVIARTARPVAIKDGDGTVRLDAGERQLLAAWMRRLTENAENLNHRIEWCEGELDRQRREFQRERRRICPPNLEPGPTKPQ